MKLLFDYFPVILFFLAFKFYGIYTATAVIIIATAVQVTWFWLQHHRIPGVHLLTFGIVVLFGGATLILHNPIFIKWKPTVVTWLLALLCCGLPIVTKTKRTFLQYLLDQKITLPAHVWIKLNWGWAFFFLVVGAVNLYVIYHYTTKVWVDFKVFGIIGATLVFSVLQSIYMTKYLKENNST
jgi:intracellular septation protein